ncbi:MAG: nuclear transport factor 2 family protein [Chloroflexota bacterium]|jgi:hypothetical protein
MNSERRLTLDLWHEILFVRRLGGLGDWLAEDIVFHSPFLWKPYHGRYPVFVILNTVSKVFRDFAYHRELVVDDVWALEFGAAVGELSIKGIDLIELNDDGLIQKFEVFVRPANGLLALGDEMQRRLTEQGFA